MPSKKKYNRVICTECLRQTEINSENEIESQKTFRCYRCESEFDYQRAIDLEWNIIHLKWVSQIGGKQVIERALINSIEGVPLRYSLGVNHYHPFFDKSVYLLYNKTHKEIIREGYSWIRERKIESILSKDIQQGKS